MLQQNVSLARNRKITKLFSKKQNKNITCAVRKLSEKSSRTHRRMKAKTVLFLKSGCCESHMADSSLFRVKIWDIISSPPVGAHDMSTTSHQMELMSQ